MDPSKAAGDSGTRPGIRVVGLDPGSRIAGWGAVDETEGRLRVVDFGVVRCPPRDPLVLRLQRLHREIGEVIRRLHPDEVAVEQVFSAASAGAALTLGHARGAVLAATAEVPVAEYSPRSVKQALTGYGAAGKGSVAGMVARRLGMAAPPDAEDAADALAVAICHLDARRAEARLARASHGRPR